MQISIKNIYEILEIELSKVELSDFLISGIQTDSRNVKQGNVFLALPCDQSQVYITQAINKGAELIIVAKNPAFSTDFITKPLIKVDDIRLAASKLAKLFYPKQPNTLATVTGTNGKTSVVTYLSQLWNYAKIEWVNFGTIGLDGSQTAKEKLSTFKMPSLTTPGPVDFHHLLDQLATSKIDHFCFETSSHALDQKRTHSAFIKAAAFTNLTQDHLDYHGTMENYLNAKLKLFSEVLPTGQWAILNATSVYFNDFAQVCKTKGHKILTYGISNNKNSFDIQASDLVHTNSLHEFGTILNLKIKDKIWENILVPLVANFQIENALAACGLAYGCGMDLEQIVEGLKHLSQVPGRLDLVATLDNGARIYVDYAHTPDALETALKVFTPSVRNKLIVVFGCGGNRDTTKRPLMGKIAHDFADHCIITDDNPRFEDPASIRAQIVNACPNATEIGDRFNAIKYGIELLTQGDVLIICGKGHEQGQIIGDKIIPFDDRQVVRSIINLT